MKINKLKVCKIQASLFKPYGWIIEYPQRQKAQKTKNLFRIVLRQPQEGWRIAYLVVRDRAIDKIESHPDSCESFEPVKGKGLLFVSQKKDASAIKCFLLDKPIVLKKGIWHAVLTITKEFDVKIVENSSVRCVYYRLKEKLC